MYLGCCGYKADFMMIQFSCKSYATFNKCLPRPEAKLQHCNSAFNEIAGRLTDNFRKYLNFIYNTSEQK